MTNAVPTPTTLAPVARRLRALPLVQGRKLAPSQPAVPAALDAYLVRLPHPVAVQFARPVDGGAPVLVEGELVAAMYARGTVHHYRVTAEGVVWLVPLVWLTPAAREAARAFDQVRQADTALLDRMRALLVTLRERNQERAMVEAGA